MTETERQALKEELAREITPLVDAAALKLVAIARRDAFAEAAALIDQHPFDEWDAWGAIRQDLAAAIRALAEPPLPVFDPHRFLPPPIQWLEFQSGSERIRLRRPTELELAQAQEGHLAYPLVLVQGEPWLEIERRPR